jgi:hypothetical protein
LTEELDEIYRRASALDPSQPSEAVRRRVLEHAAALASLPRPAANRARWRRAIFGTLAAAGLAGLLVIPRVFSPHPPAASADTAAPAKVPPVVATPPPGGAPPLADARSMNFAPAPFPSPQAAGKFRAGAPADRQGVAPQEEVQRLAEAPSRNAIASAQPASPQTDLSAALRRAAETGDVQRLRTILGAPVSVDAPDSRGRTALLLAASRGQAESVDVLLAHGADPNVVDANGVTPLKAALGAGQPAIIAALRRAGAR